MIDVDEVVPRLLLSASSIGPAWVDHLGTWDGQPAGDHNDVAVVAWHVIRLLERSRPDERDEVAAVFSVVEELLQGELSPAAHALVVIGLLEDVQTITSHDRILVGSSASVPFLGPLTLIAWTELHGSWGSPDT